MDSVMMWPPRLWKGFLSFIYVVKSFFIPSSKSITASESFYTNQILYSQEVNERIAQAVKEGNLWNVISMVRNIIMQRKSSNPVKIVVTGDSGNGMSSFINALRLIGHEEEDSAPTGVVRTTQKPALYFSSEFPNVELWDLPGTGVTSQSMENYLEGMEFDKCDLIIIIASEQFSSNHVNLAKAMQRMRRRFYIVWTKLDRDLSSSPLSEPQLLQNIQKNILENLQKEEVKEPPIFLVSSIKTLAHDFPKLRDTLTKDISNIRYTDSLETLSGICDKNIDHKAFSLKENLHSEHLQMTVSYCGTADLQESFKTYQKSFGVDDGSLQQLAQRTGTLEMGHRAMQFQDLHKMDWRLRLLMSFPVYTFFKLLAYRCWFGLWNFVVRKFRHQRQRLIIEVVAQDTKNFLRRALKDNTFPTEVL